MYGVQACVDQLLSARHDRGMFGSTIMLRRKGQHISLRLLCRGAVICQTLTIPARIPGTKITRVILTQLRREGDQRGPQGDRAKSEDCETQGSEC